MERIVLSWILVVRNHSDGFPWIRMDFLQQARPFTLDKQTTKKNMASNSTDKSERPQYLLNSLELESSQDIERVKTSKFRIGQSMDLILANHSTSSKPALFAFV